MAIAAACREGERGNTAGRAGVTLCYAECCGEGVTAVGLGPQAGGAGPTGQIQTGCK